MARASHLLLLAGSGEGRQIATALSTLPLRATASLVLADHWSGPLPLPTRNGGFGGDAGFANYLETEQITAVLDATHPFAARVSARSWAICREKGVPYLQLDRPPWLPTGDERWTEVDTAKQAAALTEPNTRVFVTTGRETLDAFVPYDDRQFFFRRLDQGGTTSDMKNITYVYGSGPFSVEEERQTFHDRAIDLLICKNAGGTVSHTKIEAAQELGIPVILLSRPQPSGAPVTQCIDDALQWITNTCL